MVCCVTVATFHRDLSVRTKDSHRRADVGVVQSGLLWAMVPELGVDTSASASEVVHTMVL